MEPEKITDSSTRSDSSASSDSPTRSDSTITGESLSSAIDMSIRWGHQDIKWAIKRIRSLLTDLEREDNSMHGSNDAITRATKITNAIFECVGDLRAAQTEIYSMRSLREDI